MNAYETLGLTTGASQEEIHAAYRKLVKKWHPDQFEGTTRQKEAQEMMIRLNLAYEEAMQLSAGRKTAHNMQIPCSEAVDNANRLYRHGSYEAALRQLCRAENKTADWFAMEGKILLALKQFSSAHQAWREAVRLDPSNKQYREGALEAAVEMKKHNRPVYRMADWLDGMFNPRGK